MDSAIIACIVVVLLISSLVFFVVRGRMRKQ